MFSHSPRFSVFSTQIFHGHPRPNPNPNPNSSSFPLSSLHFLSPSSKTLTLSSSSPSPTTQDREEENPIPIESLNLSNLSRRQNSKSAALLIQSHSQQHDEEFDEEELQRQKIVDEASLASRRNPRFPGSIDFPKPYQFPSQVVRADDAVLKKALQVRRGVAAEILKEAFRAKKLSITYSSNLVSQLDGFVDRVVIEAAAMKVVPEFSHLTFNARAKSYIHSSGVVSLVKWLKHNSFTYPQIGKLVCMSSSNLEQIGHVIEWLKKIYVKGVFLGVVLTKESSILKRKIESMQAVVDYLEKSGVKREWMGFIVSRCPQVLALTMEELEARVKFYMDMGINEKNFGTMVIEYPRVIGFFSLDEMNSKVQYLKEFGLSIEDVGRLLALKPQLMRCSIEERWKPLVKYLYYLGVSRDGMKRILLVKPMVFCVILETTIAPKVRFLQDIGIRQEDIGAVLVKFPPLLTYSLYKKIRPVVIFLMTKAGVTKSDIAKVIAFDPQLLGCSIIEKLEVNVKYFLSLGIRLRTLGEMIADFPMLLRYSSEVIQPKYRYLRRTMVRPLQDLIEYPRFLSYSLEGRIMPRHEILVANRLNFKLRYMLPGSDEQFHLRVQAAIENRTRFESGNIDPIDSDPPSSASQLSLRRHQG